ncbi:hypothetical protein Q9L58_010622, partial [Maublancomyces gigas]
LEEAWDMPYDPRLHSGPKTPGNPLTLNKTAYSAYLQGLTPVAIWDGSFRGPADDKPSPETPTRKRRPYDEGFFNSPGFPNNSLSNFEGEHYPQEDPNLPIPNYKDGSNQGDWEAEEYSDAAGPSTPPNKLSVHFQDTEATPKPIPRATETLDDSEMSEAEDTTDYAEICPFPVGYGTQQPVPGMAYSASLSIPRPRPQRLLEVLVTRMGAPPKHRYSST